MFRRRRKSGNWRWLHFCFLPYFLSLHRSHHWLRWLNPLFIIMIVDIIMTRLRLTPSIMIDLLRNTQGFILFPCSASF